jgi:hypothetical protein
MGSHPIASQPSSPSPRLTDERLKSWLDNNHLDRERLCQAVMALDRRFTDVRLRQPKGAKGGPDGGRDLEANILEDHSPIWGAIGFLNSPSDSPANRRQIKQKFKSDVARALKGDCLAMPERFVGERRAAALRDVRYAVPHGRSFRSAMSPLRRT